MTLLSIPVWHDSRRETLFVLSEVQGRRTSVSPKGAVAAISASTKVLFHRPANPEPAPPPSPSPSRRQAFSPSFSELTAQARGLRTLPTCIGNSPSHHAATQLASNDLLQNSRAHGMHALHHLQRLDALAIPLLHRHSLLKCRHHSRMQFLPNYYRYRLLR